MVHDASPPLARLGVAYPARAAPEGFLPFASRVEELGFRHLWVVEDCFLAGGLTLAASALATTALNVGVGLMPAPVRNPALAAMEIATLARAYPGRFTAAFGHGVRSWMAQIGALPPRRLAALEEVTAAVRALLAGELVSCSGAYVNLSEVRLEMPPVQRPSVLVGSTGPEGLRLAGRAADGILLPEGCGPDFVRWALERDREGGADDTTDADPKGEPRRCVTYAWLSLDERPERALHRLEPTLAHWAERSDLYPFPHAIANGKDDPIRSPGALNVDSSADAELGELARRVAICGDPAMCADAVGQFIAAGTQQLILVPQSPDLVKELERFVADVVPRLSVGEPRTV